MMHHRPSDPDADRPCSCEESLQLKAAALELQNQLMAMAEEKAAAEAAASELRGQYAEKSEALILAETRAIAAESDANVNRQERERLEARVRELERFIADDGLLTERDFWRAQAEARMHIVTDADLKVLEVMRGLKIIPCLDVFIISDANEHALCLAELARRGEKL